MTSGKTTAQRRTDLKVDFSKALRASLFAVGMTYGELAEHVGVSDTKVGNWCSPKSAELPCIASLAMFPPALALAILPYLTRDHGVAIVKRAPVEPTMADHLERFGELAAKTASATTTYARALRDGHVDPVEEREVREALLEVRNEADSQLHAIDSRARGLRVAS